MLKSLMVFLKGLWIGGTMTVPGVSGGSMAMILNIYDRLISAIASFRRHPKRNALFLLKFAFGAVLGFVLFSKYILVPLMTMFPMPVSYFFLGAVAGGAPMIYKTAGVKKFTASAIVYPVVGIILVLLIALIPSGLFSPSAGLSIGKIFLQLLGGIIIAAALILPGISVSQMLLMLGLYAELLEAVDTMNVLPFIPLGLGVVIGSVCCAKAMEKAMAKYPQPTYLIVFGFLLGSLPKLFPGFPVGWSIPICVVAFIAGFSAIYFLQVFESKKIN